MQCLIYACRSFHERSVRSEEITHDNMSDNKNKKTPPDKNAPHSTDDSKSILRASSQPDTSQNKRNNYFT